MDWAKLGQAVANYAVPALAVALIGLLIYLGPQLRGYLKVKYGEAVTAQIEAGLAIAVRAAETATGLTTNEQKKAFAVKMAQDFFDTHGIKLDAGELAGRIEAALLKQKMEGMRASQMIIEGQVLERGAVKDSVPLGRASPHNLPPAPL